MRLASFACAIILVSLFTAETYPQFTTTLNLPPDPNIGNSKSIGSDTQLNLFDGGEIGVGFDAGSSEVVSTNVEVNVFGGVVGRSLTAFRGSVVNIAGGLIDERLTALGGIVNISGGSIGEFLTAYSRSVVNISGGSVGANFRASDGGVVNVSGGKIDWSFYASEGSKVHISGGAIGDWFRADPQSDVTISGNQFSMNGFPIAGLDTAGNTLNIDIPNGAVLSGTLADGTPFAFLSYPYGMSNLFGSDSIAAGVLTLKAAVLPAIGPATITLPGDSTPLGIRSGQKLIIEGGGDTGDNFHAGRGATVVVAGGTVGNFLEAVGAEVNISGGSIGNHFDVYDGSVVNITGGAVGFGLRTFDGSVVNVSGGVVGDVSAYANTVFNVSSGEVDAFRAFGGSVVNILGGSIGETSGALAGSVVNIFGGTIGDHFVAADQSEVNLFVRELLIDGELVDLVPGEAFTIATRGGALLEATLADGSYFDLRLDDSFEWDLGEDLIQTRAILTAHWVPEPTTECLALLTAIAAALVSRRAWQAAPCRYRNLVQSPIDRVPRKLPNLHFGDGRRGTRSQSVGHRRRTAGPASLEQRAAHEKSGTFPSSAWRAKGRKRPRTAAIISA